MIAFLNVNKIKRGKGNCPSPFCYKYIWFKNYLPLKAGLILGLEYLDAGLRPLRDLNLLIVALGQI